MGLRPSSIIRLLSIPPIWWFLAVQHRNPAGDDAASIERDYNVAGFVDRCCSYAGGAVTLCGAAIAP
jgi:hypothetical protein